VKSKNKKEAEELSLLNYTKLLRALDLVLTPANN